MRRSGPLSSKPSRRQSTCLLAIHAFIEQNGYPPTVGEISAALRCRSRGGVMTSFTALRVKGYLQSRPVVARSHTLTELGKDWVRQQLEKAATGTVPGLPAQQTQPAV